MRPTARSSPSTLRSSMFDWEAYLLLARELIVSPAEVLAEAAWRAAASRAYYAAHPTRVPMVLSGWAAAASDSVSPRVARCEVDARWRREPMRAHARSAPACGFELTLRTRPDTPPGFTGYIQPPRRSLVASTPAGRRDAVAGTRGCADGTPLPRIGGSRRGR